MNLPLLKPNINSDGVGQYPVGVELKELVMILSVSGNSPRACDLEYVRIDSLNFATVCSASSLVHGLAEAVGACAIFKY